MIHFYLIFQESIQLDGKKRAHWRYFTWRCYTSSSSQQTLTELWKPHEELVPYKKREELVPYKEQIKNKFEAMINTHLSRDEISEQEAIYLFNQLKRIIDLSNETDIRNIEFLRNIYNKTFYDLVRNGIKVQLFILH